MRLFETMSAVMSVGLVLLASPAWAQEPQRSVPAPAATGPGSDVSISNDNTEDTGRMLVPPPASGQSYPTIPTSEERSNYLRGGLAFITAYTDNAIGAVNGAPVSDVSYSVMPRVALDDTTTRLHLGLTYAPGFTFYQRESALNEADQNALINFEYRLSPHVTFSARDSFQKSSNVFNQPDLESAVSVSGGAPDANQSVIAPIADRLSNTGNVGISYQFAANSMVGASGTFTNLHYPDPSEVPGLFDSSAQSASAFYSMRIAKRHYLGAAYQYQRLLSYPAPGINETQTHALLAFYTVYPTLHFSVSVFGGPQYADSGPQFSQTGTAPSPSQRSWNPAAGASLSWQGLRSSLAIGYAHLIASGGGLIGAVQMDSAGASFRQQLLRSLGATLGGGYAQNDVLTGTPVAGSNGHTLSGTASLQQQFGQHVNVQLGYTRLRQDYSLVAVLATAPNTNREFVSISYQFSRGLGR